MSESQIWNDNTREELRETLRAITLGEVRLANSDRNGILEICREVYIEDECPENEWETFTNFATKELEKAYKKQSIEQKNWPDETDCDRLDQVEAYLRERGILLWQVSPCCDTCSVGELPERIDEIDQRHPGFRESVRGYAFFIDQNIPEMLAESAQLSIYLAYGWFSPDNSEVAPDVYEKNALNIANEICNCFREFGFKPEWDGDFSKKIGVSINWQRRTLLQ